jgi:hypothetical protein
MRKYKEQNVVAQLGNLSQYCEGWTLRSSAAFTGTLRHQAAEAPLFSPAAHWPGHPSLNLSVLGGATSKKVMAPPSTPIAQLPQREWQKGSHLSICRHAPVQIFLHWSHIVVQESKKCNSFRKMLDSLFTQRLQGRRDKYPPRCE